MERLDFREEGGPFPERLQQQQHIRRRRNSKEPANPAEAVIQNLFSRKKRNVATH